MVRYLFLLLAVLVMAGCSTNSTFVYKPVAPVVGAQKLPVKVAVLPFKDGTEDFTKRGSVFSPESLFYNLAKAGIGGQITALTPDLWAKALADDMVASGSFQAVRFVYGQSELVDEDYYIEGTLEKATISGSWAMPSEFALGLRALRRTGNQQIWQKEVAYAWTNTPALYQGCGAMSVQCMVDRHHADTNRVIQRLLTEARVDLVRTLVASPGGRTGEGGSSPAKFPARPAPESADETIESILKGK
ncbi:MAG: hypothetical protein HGB32_14760 [Geobacteraceae bacterium]|nr:hypothetical protein [Geobacteraceae bacterium]NTW81386.1 hypothetical protein [Geobacteraceae bacterium]